MRYKFNCICLCHLHYERDLTRDTEKCSRAKYRVQKPLICRAQRCSWVTDSCEDNTSLFIWSRDSAAIIHRSCATCEPNVRRRSALCAMRTQSECNLLTGNNRWNWAFLYLLFIVFSVVPSRPIHFFFSSATYCYSFCLLTVRTVRVASYPSVESLYQDMRWCLESILCWTGRTVPPYKVAPSSFMQLRVYVINL